MYLIRKFYLPKTFLLKLSIMNFFRKPFLIFNEQINKKDNKFIK